MEKQKYIALDTANKMLPLVRPITEDIVKNWTEVDQAVQLLREQKEKKQSEEVQLQTTTRIHKLTRQLTENLDELESLGCIVESYELGIIDFPSEVDGEAIMLCWSVDEKEISHYHKPGETVKQRLLLKETLE